MDRQINRQTYKQVRNRQMDKQTDGWIDGCMNRCTDSRTYRLIEKWTDVLTERHRTYRQTDRWRDRQTEKIVADARKKVHALIYNHIDRQTDRQTDRWALGQIYEIRRVTLLNKLERLSRLILFPSQLSRFSLSLSQHYSQI